MVAPHPRIVDLLVATLGPLQLAVRSHQGPMERVIDAIEDLVHWVRSQPGTAEEVRYFQIFHNDPRMTPPDDYRTDICAAFAGEIAPNAYGVTGMTLPAMACVRCRCRGPHEALPPILREALPAWFAANGERRRPPLGIWEYVVSLPPPSLRCDETPAMDPADFVTDCYTPLATDET